VNILITGSRDWPEDDPGPISLILDRVFWGKDDEEPYHVYVGDCPTGVDKIVRDELKWIEEHRKKGLPTVSVYLHVFKANWTLYGHAAGPIRNGVMVKEATPVDPEDGPFLAYAFHASRPHYENERSGTNDCARKARHAGAKIYDIVRRA